MAVFWDPNLMLQDLLLPAMMWEQGMYETDYPLNLQISGHVGGIITGWLEDSSSVHQVYLSRIHQVRFIQSFSKK